MTSKSKTFYTVDNGSVDLTFDGEPTNRDKHKFDFTSIQLDRESKLNQDDSSITESIRSTQISHSSVNPLHG
jgi:hypothetical protein